MACPCCALVLQDLVAGHDPALDFIENQMATELDLGPANVSRNGAGVRLEQAEHFLV